MPKLIARSPSPLLADVTRVPRIVCQCSAQSREGPGESSLEAQLGHDYATNCATQVQTVLGSTPPRKARKHRRVR